MEGKIRLAVFGQKRLSREGGIEIVVKELCTRMAQNGCDITCYNRAGHHVSGAEYDKTIEYDGIRQKVVPTIEKKGLAAVSSSFFAALYSAFGRYDVVHRKDRYEKIKDFYDQTILLCQNLDFPEVVKTRFSSVYLAFVIATLKMIVLSEESTTEKLSHIKAIEKDSHLKTVLGKVNPKIESKSRNFIRMGLLKEQTLVCYAMLYLKYKL